MKKIIITVYFFIGIIQVTQAQDKNLYQRHWLVQKGDTLPYRILFPLDYNPSKSYPMVLFLHGRGESGIDNEKQLTHGYKMFLVDSIRNNYPAIIVFPQCSTTDYWSNVQMIFENSKTDKKTFYFIPDGTPSLHMQMTIGLVHNLLGRYNINKDQVYAMGLSMGGMGTFEIVRRMPGVFAAAVPICGGADPSTAKELKRVNWWIFHGGKDDVVLPIYSTQMVDALKKQKASVKFTLFPNANHNSWDSTFAQPGLMKWLFEQKKN
jgi:predicted peptidase